MNKSNSQSGQGQELHVLGRIYRGKQNGYFVEAGAQDGFELSNTYLLEKEYGWKGVCVECNPRWFAKLSGTRSSLNLPFALYSEDGKRLDFYDTGNGLGALAGTNHNPQIAGAPVIKVRTKKLITILDEAKAPHFIEFLSLDTEGSEYEILKCHDFDKYLFGYICVEHNHDEKKRKAIRELLEKKEYLFYRENRVDDDYIHRSLLTGRIRIQWLIGKGRAFLTRLVQKGCEKLRTVRIKQKLFLTAYTLAHFSPNILRKEYRFDPADLDPEKRKSGISGILRVLNEEEFLARAIESHLPFLDEIVIALNPRCTDRSYEICHDYRKKHPEKIKIVEYRIHMPIWGDARFAELRHTSPHHFVTYSNWALSKAGFKIVYPIFGDAIAIPAVLKKVTDDIRKNGLKEFLAVSAIDLYDDDHRLYVIVHEANHPWKGGAAGLDLGFFPLNTKTYYDMSTDWPQFIRETGYRVSGEILFFHVKGLKRDRGAANRAGNQHYFMSEKRRPSKLMPWDEFKKAYKVPDIIPSPEELGIKPLYQRG